MESFRYHRQIIVPEIGNRGQEILANTHIAIVGCGGLGSNSADFLTRLGIGQLTLIDHDLVELTNLHRTSLYTEQDIHQPKSTALSTHLKNINSQLKITSQTSKLTIENAETILAPCDIILDGTDNLLTRYLINEFAIKNNKPWVYSGVHTTIGMVLAIIPNHTPCLSCLSEKLPPQTKSEIPVLGTLPATIASLQITETLKLLFNKPLSGFLIFNIWTQQLDKLTIKKKADCTICHNHKYNYLPRK